MIEEYISDLQELIKFSSCEETNVKRILAGYALAAAHDTGVYREAMKIVQDEQRELDNHATEN